jgi:hypothetical protein
VTALTRRVLEASSWVSAVRNVVWVAGAIGVAGVAVLYLTDSSPHARIGALCLLVAATLTGAGMLIHRSYSRTAAAGMGYRTVSIKYVYTFDKRDHGRQRQEVTTTIEALRNGVSLVEAKYRWSGRGGCRISLASKGQVLLADPMMTYGGWTRYYVHLLRPLARGERAEIQIRQDVEDADRRMDFVLTKTVRERLETLTLAVTFPANGPRAEDVWAIERRGPLDDVHGRRQIDIDYDAKERRAKLTMWKPTPGRTYAIEWMWPQYRGSAGP